MFKITLPINYYYLKSISSFIEVFNVITSSKLDNEHLSNVLNIVP